MRTLLAIPVLLLALAGCAPQGTPGETTAPQPSTSVTPDAPVATAAIISLEGLTVVDQNGEALEATRFDDPTPVLFLLDGLLGSTPEPTEYPDFGTTTYEWPGVLFGLRGDDYSWLRVDVSELGELPVQTTDGIAVGSSRGEVLATAPYDGEYDTDGDGDSDFYGLEPVTNDDYESLSFPGQPGTDFIEVQLEDDTVSSLRSPSNDYTDV